MAGYGVSLEVLWALVKRLYYSLCYDEEKKQDRQDNVIQFLFNLFYRDII